MTITKSEIKNIIEECIKEAFDTHQAKKEIDKRGIYPKKDWVWEDNPNWTNGLNLKHWKRHIYTMSDANKLEIACVNLLDSAIEEEDGFLVDKKFLNYIAKLIL